MGSYRVLTFAAIMGGWILLSPTFAEARTRPARANARLRNLITAQQEATGLSPNLGFGQLPLPLNQQEVNRFVRNYFQNPMPRISPQLRANPYSEQANLRRAFALEVFRERAMAKVSSVAGGVYFSPPNGTPYFPLVSNNFLRRLPVFRVLGIF